MQSMGTMRVNGVLGVSRAIGKLILLWNIYKIKIQFQYMIYVLYLTG